MRVLFDALDNRAGALLSAIATGRGLLAFFVVYGVLHAAVSLLAGPAIALDDVKLNVVTQSLEAGYQPENPPLFEWLLILVQQATGPTLLSFLVVKYVLFAATGVFTFLAARIAFADNRRAAATAFALLLIYQFSWNYHQAFTHSIALIAAVAFFWWALLRVVRTPDAAGFAFLGAAFGAGVLAKYSFLAAGPFALVAALSTVEGRRAFRSPCVLIAFAVAAALVAPHALWLAAENAAVAELAADRLTAGDTSYLTRVAKGLPEAIWSVLAFSLPLAPLAAAFAWPLSAKSRTASAEIARRATLAGAIALPLAVILFGFSGMQERYAIPFMFPLVFWIMSLLDARAAARVAAAACVMATALLGLRAVTVMSPGPPFCSDCRQWIPYDALGDALAAAGAVDATLVAYDDHTAGNLRRMFPRARILSSHMPFYTPPITPGSRTCWFVYSFDLSEPPPESVRAALAEVDEAIGDWRPLIEGAPRQTRWTYATVSDDALRRSLCKLP